MANQISSRPAILTCAEDVMNDAKLKKRGDEIIRLVSKMNNTDQQPDDATRMALWTRVFSGGWTTTSQGHGKNPPFMPHKRPNDLFALEVGVSSQDQPWSAPTVIPDRRRQGAPVFLKPYLYKTSNNMGVTWLDTRGMKVSPRYVTLSPGLDSKAKASAAAIFHWDRAERKRLGEHNMAVAVCWARNKLIQQLLLEKAQGSVKLPKLYDYKSGLKEVKTAFSFEAKLKESAGLLEETDGEDVDMAMDGEDDDLAMDSAEITEFAALVSRLHQGDVAGLVYF